MRDTPGQTTKDVAALLNQHRQELQTWQEQLEDFQKRLQVFRQRQQALQEQIDILRREKEYLTMLRQEGERKQQQRRWQGSW